MNVNYYIKAVAVATLIALAVITIKRERKQPVVVTKVTEILVMKAAHAQEIAPPPVVIERKPTLIERTKKAVESAKEKIVIPHHDHPSRTRTVDGSGDTWSFPYSCSKVKWYAAHFSQSTLDSMRKLAGEPEPNAHQMQQIRECLNGKFQ